MLYIMLRCRALQREVAKQKSTKFCDVLESEPDFQTHLRLKRLRGSLP